MKKKKGGPFTPLQTQQDKTTTKSAVPDFHFDPPDGSDPTFEMDFRDLGFVMRASRSGRRVLVFPAPYQQLEIAEHERVSAAKWERIQAALAELQARRKG